MNRVVALDLDDHLPVNDEIRPKAALQLHRFVDQRYGFLSLHMQPKLLKFINQRRLAGRFEQWRARVFDGS